MKNKIVKERKKDLHEFQKILKIRFKNLNLLNQGLTHSSYAHETYNNEEHNEKFEFLGDSILSMFTVEYLFFKYTELREGDLSKLKSYIVSEEVLYNVSKKIDLNKYLLLGRGEERTGGRMKKSLISDALEAIIGAYYIDSGLKKSKKLILKIFFDVIKDYNGFPSILDYKSELQKDIQKVHKKNPEYYLIKTTGPDHEKTFKVGVRVNKKVLGIGEGYNKQSAEKEAAKDAIKSLRELS